MSGGCDGENPPSAGDLKGVRMTRYKVGRVQWWEATSVGDLKGMRMPRYNVGRVQW